MTTIHLIGSEGFIGRAVQREASGLALQCWSHRPSGTAQRFDLLEPQSWQPLLESGPQVAILLSWPGLPHYDASFHLTRNLPAALELVEQLRTAGLQRLVVAGTCYEYGLQDGPLRESQPADPVNAYAIAKDSLRRALGAFSAASALQWCWLRIFYPYGDGQNPASLLPSLERAIAEGAESFAMSSGRQLRDLLPVEEVARQLLLLATHPAAHGIYNGGSGAPRSLRELVEAKVASLGATIRLELGARADRPDEPVAFWADMSRLHALQSTAE